jgi:hypothetical protein
VVDRGFEPWSDQNKYYKIGICCFSAKYATLRGKSKDWLAQNQDNVFEWSDMSTRRLLTQDYLLLKAGCLNSVGQFRNGVNDVKRQMNNCYVIL